MTCLLKPGSYRATRGHCAHSRKVAIRQLRRNLRRLQRAPPCGRVKNASLILDMHTLQRQMNTHKLFTQRQSWRAEHQIKEATPFPRLSHFFTDFAGVFQRLAALVHSRQVQWLSWWPTGESALLSAVYCDRHNGHFIGRHKAERRHLIATSSLRPTAGIDWLVERVPAPKTSARGGGYKNKKQRDG